MTYAIAIGKFDALHNGHRLLAERAAGLGETALLTFSGMAETLGWPTRTPLTAPSDRVRILESWVERSTTSQHAGPTLTAVADLVLPFAGIRSLTPREFLVLLRDRLRAGAVVVGEDFRFGRDRSGGIGELQMIGRELGLRVCVLPTVQYAGIPVSSSRVRAALAAGDCGLVNFLLARYHRLVGAVVRGDGRGRTIGVPTANCGRRENQEPAPGVYAAFAELAGGAGGRIPAAVNIGHVPTAGADRPLTVEAHLIGYQGDCYDQRLTLDFVEKIRDERRFADLAALRAQIALDIEVCAGRLAREPEGGWGR